MQALKDSLFDIKQNLHPRNLSKFENDVEVHMQHIQTGLSQMGNLRVFMKAPAQQTASGGGAQQNSNNSTTKIKLVPAVRIKSEKQSLMIQDEDDSS